MNQSYLQVHYFTAKVTQDIFHQIFNFGKIGYAFVLENCVVLNKYLSMYVAVLNH